VQDSYIAGNQFIRDAGRQNDPGTIHMLTVDFASRIAVVGNSFLTSGGAIRNKTRNDGEAILTEGGGGNRTEYLGTVQSATQTSLTDPGMQLKADPFWTGKFPDTYGISIVAGTGAGQTRYIRTYASGTVTIDRPWDVVPDGTSKYSAAVWGIEKSLLKDNFFRDMPRGIWIYQTSARDLEIVGNRFEEGGGIYLRAYQRLNDKMFNAMFNIKIKGNVVGNKTSLWTSHITSMFANSDARAFGIAMLGITITDNQIWANSPNLFNPYEEYAGNEGFINMMRVENYDGYESMSTPRVLGTIFHRNWCANCEVQYRVGTGAGGTIISTTSSSNSPKLWENWKTTSSNELATNTLVE
jgi:hypothetical protein